MAKHIVVKANILVSAELVDEDVVADNEPTYSTKTDIAVASKMQADGSEEPNIETLHAEHWAACRADPNYDLD